jgi:hypothetical protein
MNRKTGSKSNLGLQLVAGLLLGIPIVTGLFVDRVVETSFEAYLAAHYLLYLSAVICAAIDFYNTMYIGEENPQWMHDLLPNILLFVFVFDISAPMQFILSFSILKCFFYLLLIVQISRFIFDTGRLFRVEDTPTILCALLVAVAARFLSEPSQSYIMFLEDLSFLKVLLHPRFVEGLLFFLMIGTSALLFFQPGLLASKAISLPIVSASTIACITGYQMLSGLVPSVPEIHIPFSSEFLCLFLYLLVFSAYGTKWTISLAGRPIDLKFIGFGFALAFSFIYIRMNIGAIFTAIDRVRMFLEVRGYWGMIVGVGAVVGFLVVLVWVMYRIGRKEEERSDDQLAGG